jgi:hypothetical protein
VDKRIKYEKNAQTVPFSESGITFWPSADELCASKAAGKQPGKCLTGLYRTDEEEVLGIEENRWKLREVRKLLEEKVLVKKDQGFWKGVWERDYLRTVPEVPVIVIFGANLRQMRYEWFSLINFTQIQAGKGGKAEATKAGSGDGLFQTHSSLLLPFRWALGDFSGTKRPVLFLEYCSINRSLTDIYDKKIESEEYQITETRYNGIGCRCTKEGDAGCGHFDVLDDQKVIEVIQKTLVGNQRASDSQLERIRGFREEVLQEEVRRCSFLETSHFSADQFKHEMDA